jgi:hypothetical protein
MMLTAGMKNVLLMVNPRGYVDAYSINPTRLRHLDQDQRPPVIKSPPSRF